jgi:hypothetical protein
MYSTTGHAFVDHPVNINIYFVPALVLQVLSKILPAFMFHEILLQCFKIRIPEKEKKHTSLIIYMEEHQLVDLLFQLIDMLVGGLFRGPLNIPILMIDSRELLLFKIK